MDLQSLTVIDCQSRAHSCAGFPSVRSATAI